jgi:hypothetical protein
MERKGRKTRRKGGSSAVDRKEKGPHFNETHGLYKKIDLSTLDGRTKLGRAAKEIQTDLQNFVGKGNVVTDLLITQIIYKALRLQLYQGNNFDNPKDSEVAHFIPLSNSLRLDLQELARLAGEARPPSLDDYLKGLKEAGK